MKDPHDPRAPEDVLDALLAGMQPGDPLTEEVERVLNETGGPVPVDDDAARAAAEGVLASIRGTHVSASPEPATRPGWRTAVAIAAAALLAVGIFSTGPAATVAPTPAVTKHVQPDPSQSPHSTFEIRDGSVVDVRSDRIVLLDGVVSVHHEANELGVHSVRLAALDVTIEPVGTLYFAGSAPDVAAVWVQEGSVKLVHPQLGHLGEVAAGHWALLTSQDDDIVVHRIDEGPFDPSERGLEHTAIADLLADIRWMALPQESRSSILRSADLD